MRIGTFESCLTLTLLPYHNRVWLACFTLFQSLVHCAMTVCANEGVTCYGDVVFSDLLPETGYLPVYSQWLWYSKLKLDGQVRELLALTRPPLSWACPMSGVRGTLPNPPCARL